MKPIQLLAVCCMIMSVKSSVNMESKSADSCDYKDDMCAVPTSCLAKYEDTRLCEYLKHSAVYQTSSPSVIQIKLYRDYVRSYEYPDELQVSVVRATEESLVPADGCCNLREKSHCILPQLTGEDERYIAFAPIYWEDGVQEYCHLEIMYEPAHNPKWCAENPQTPCVYMKNGILEINDTYMTLSSIGDVLPSVEYCMFYAPSHFISNGTRLIPSISKPSTDIVLQVSNDTAHGKDFDVRCKRLDSSVSDLPRVMMSENVVPGHVVCTVFRLKQYNEEWNNSPFCLSEPGQAAPNYNTITILSAICITCFILACMAGRQLYKRVNEGGLARKIRIPSTIPDKVMSPGNGTIAAEKETGFPSVKSNKGRYVTMLEKTGVTLCEVASVEEDVHPVIAQDKPILHHLLQSDEVYLSQEKTPTKFTLVVANYNHEDEITTFLESSGPNYIHQIDGSNTTLNDDGYVTKSYFDD